MPRRRLSPEEEDLWREVAATTAPMRAGVPAAAPAMPPAPAGAPGTPHPLAEGPPARRKAEPGRVTLNLAPDPHALLVNAHPQMDRRRFEKLRRGRLEPEARLDLHGMTSERAHAALNAFILAAHASGLRLVLVITGKGRPGELDAMAPHRHGVLRHSLPHWLGAPPLRMKVLHAAPAHTRHGGGGAFYVYLRRQR